MLKNSLYFKFLRYAVRLRMIYRSYSPQERKKISIWAACGGVGILLLCLVLWNYFKKKDTWEVIPDNALLIVECQKPLAFASKTDSSEWIQNAKEIPYFDTLSYHFSQLRQLADSQGVMPEWLVSTPLTASLHTLSTTELAWLYAFGCEEKERPLLTSFIQKAAQHYNFFIEKRIYEDVEVVELKSNKTYQVLWAYAFVSDFWVGSYSAMLIEDAIRQANDGGNKAFASRHRQMEKVVSLGKYDAELFINSLRLKEALRIFSAQEYSYLMPLTEVLNTLQFDVLISPKDANLHGFSYTDEKHNDFFALFQQQTPEILEELLYYVPSRTAFFMRFALSDFKKFAEKTENLWENTDKNLIAEIEDAEKQGIERKDLFKTFEKEVALCVMEKTGDEPLEKIAIIRLHNAIEAQDILQAHSTEAAQENYFKWKIRKIKIQDLPQKLFGRAFSGFQECFYTIIDQKYLLLTTSHEAIGRLAQDIQDERIWAKMVSHRRFISKLPSKSNIQLIIHLPRIWAGMMEGMNQDWKRIFEAHKFTLLHYELLGFSMTAQEERSDLQAVISLDNQKEETQTHKKGFELDQKTVFVQPLISKPDIVRNYADKSLEVMAVDAWNALHLISKDGKILWSRSMSEKVMTKVQQIDLLNNGKLQYTFATTNKVYAFDRLGRIASNFPFSLPSGNTIEWLVPISYENNGDYRFLVAAQQGNVFMLNEAGKMLDGWNPMALGSGLLVPPTYLRVGKSDFIITVEKTGIISLFQRNSKIQKGFPIDIQNSIGGDIVIKKGTQEANTTITILTKDGEYIRFNLKGEIEERKQFTRKNKVLTYQLCKDGVAGKEWVAAAQGGEEVLIMNETGKVLFSKIFKNKTPKKVQYYNFGANVEVIAITDTQEKYTYLYYADGTLIQHRPLPSNDAISLIYRESEKEFEVYRFFKNEAHKLIFHK